MNRYESVQVIDSGNGLQHIVQNALNNTICFTAEKSRIDVGVFIEDNTVHFLVKDSGLGIDEQ